MAGVFLSHSTRDKKFVSRLAVDLIARGIPVWFDTWEIETGDNLPDRIFNGIDESTFLLVALSPNSVNSPWVGRELGAALAKEGNLNRKVILPIKIAPCEAPASIADRICADFTLGYRKELEALESLLRRRLPDSARIAPEHQLLPLVFTHGLFLEQVQLQEIFERIVPSIEAGRAISMAQILLAPDDKLEEMREVFLSTIDGIADHPHYSPETEYHFHDLLASLRRLEAALTLGIVEISTGVVAMRDSSNFSLASHWFARIIRNNILWVLLQAWNFARGDAAPPLGKQVVAAAMTNNTAAARFYGVGSVEAFDIFRPDRSEQFTVWIDRRSLAGLDFEKNPRAVEELSYYWFPDEIHKYIVPQMVASYRYYNRSSRPIPWDLRDWMICQS